MIGSVPIIDGIDHVLSDILPTKFDLGRLREMRKLLRLPQIVYVLTRIDYLRQAEELNLANIDTLILGSA